MNAHDAPDPWTPRRTARLAPSEPSDATPLPARAMIGRFAVIEPIGRGGMGEVFRAYDPELRREVAIKLMAASDQSEQLHMLREARALAALSHPGIVTVYDVGWCSGRVFVAMELIEGAPLSAWLGEERSASDVLGAFADIAGSLASAHDAGIVHGDVKPENAMVADDGRVIVLDFGLARRPDAAPSRAASRRRWVGTPRYMAPEQFAGEDATARADQFSFAVALYVALYGEFPFGGSDAEEIAAAVTAARAVSVPSRRGVPPAVRHAIAAALSASPEARLPDMRTFAAHLRAAGRPSRRATLAIGAGVALAATVAVVALGRGAAPTKCARGPELIASVWSEGVRDRVGRQLTDSGLPDGGRWVRRLDDYATRWLGEYESACRATHVHGEQSAKLLDRRMSCLERRRAALGATAESLASSALTTVEASRASFAIDRLPDIDDCDASLTLARPYRAEPLSSEQQQLERELLRSLERAVADNRLARHEHALEVATALLARAQSEPLDELRARAELLAGEALAELGRPKDALAAFTRALPHASRAGLAALEVEILAQMLFTSGNDLDEFSQANVLADVARAAAARSPSPERAGALIDARLGNVLRAAGQPARARELLESAIVVLEDSLGPDAPLTLGTRNNLGITLEDLGALDDAVTVFDDVAARRERAYGPGHPTIAEALNNAGVALRQNGRLDEAVARYSKALAIWRASLPDDHPNIAQVLNNLGSIELARGRLDEARTLYEQSLVLVKKRLGPGHARVAQPTMNLGVVALESGDLAGARRLFEQALAIQTNRLGDDHPEVGLSLINLGEVSYRQGRYDDAVAPLERATAILERAHGPDHTFVGYALLTLGSVELERSRPRKAREPLRRAAKILADAADPQVRERLARELRRAGLSS